MKHLNVNKIINNFNGEISSFIYNEMGKIIKRIP